LDEAKRKSGLGRMIGRRRLLVSATALAAGAGALIPFGCGSHEEEAPATAPGTDGNGTPTPGHPRQGGTLRTLGGAIGSLPDPHKTKNNDESLLWQWAGNLLVRYSQNEPYGVEADLAATMPEIPGDGTTFIFKIQPEAKWQNRAPVNGRVVTAEDVKLSFDRIKALGAKSPRAGNYANVDQITVIDAATVRFKLKAPQADLFNVMADQYDILLPKEIASRGDEAIKGMEDMIGSGPYELQSYEPGRKAQLKRRSDGYWRPNTAWVDAWDLLDVRDDGQKANGLLAGQGDVAELPPVLARIFEARNDFTVVRTPSPSRECLLINHTAAKWKDPRVRLAVSRAIDRRQVYAAAFESEGAAGGPMAAAAKLWALPEKELSALPGYGERSAELREAKALLASAGLAGGFEDTILTVTALRMDVVAQAVADSLAEIGIRLKVQSLGDDFAALTERARKGDFTLIATSFLAGIYPDAQLYLYHHSSGSANYGKFSSAALDAKLDKQRGLYDQAQRVALVQEIQRDLINAPGPVWLGARRTLTAVNKRVHNLVPTPFVSGYDDAENAWLAP
jgi:peptide/nickel transport system substrate-binding protein